MLGKFGEVSGFEGLVDIEVLGESENFGGASGCEDLEEFD